MVADESNPLPPEAGSWELEGPAVISERLGFVRDPSFVGMTGGEGQRKKAKGKCGKAVADESNPLPREAGRWELEGYAVIATRPTAKRHRTTLSLQGATAGSDEAIPM